MSRQGPAVSRLHSQTSGRTCSSKLSLLEGCSRFRGCYIWALIHLLPFPSASPTLLKWVFPPSPELLNISSAFPQTPELSLTNQHLGSAGTFPYSQLSSQTGLSPIIHLTPHLSTPVVYHVLYTLEFVSLLWPAVPTLVKHSRGNPGKARTKTGQFKCT